MKLPVVMIAVGLISVSSAAVLCVIGLDDLQVGDAAGTADETELASLESSTEQQVSEDEGPVEPLNNAEAFTNIETYLVNHPNDRRRAYQYGRALVGLGELKRAEEFYLEQLEEHPSDIQIWYGLGCCYEVSRRWQDSIDAYSKALDISYEHVGAKNNLAWVLATCPDERFRNGSKAVALAKNAVGNEVPPNPALMDTLAASYAELGDFAKAIKVQKYVVHKVKDKSKTECKDRLQLYQRHQPYRVQ